MRTDRRFLSESGTEVFTGNELLVKGALETEGGVHLLGGYPGSPVAGFFDTLAVVNDLLASKGIRALINNNEALAAAMLNGTQTLPARAMMVIKSVGVHVAADALALANLAGANREGGAIVVYGDDPWSDSTQVPADSRYLSKHLFIPTIEPSNAQEVKDWVDLSFKLSRRSELLAGLIVTTNLADGGGNVTCRANHYPEKNLLNQFDLDTARIDVNKRVLLPPKTWWQEESLGPRHQRAKAVARELGLNRIESPVTSGRAPVGFVTAGLAHDYLTQALDELGLLGQLPILKLGMSYPLDEAMLEELAAQVQRIVVVEERRGFIEEQAGQALLAATDSDSPLADVQLYGKRFPHDLPGLPETRGLHPSMLIERLGPLLHKLLETPETARCIDGELKRLEQNERLDLGDVAIPPRLPTFCPGCPHRDSASLCLDIKNHFRNPHYMRHHHGRDPMDLMFHGDIGCYTMLMYPPNTDLMSDLSGMGLGGGTGSGNDRLITNKEVVFMGDSTFYHCGVSAISQAIKLGQDITFIILDNATTAMTGHQPTPGVDYDILGQATARQDIEDVVRGLGSSAELPLWRVNPEQREEYRQLLEEVFLADGVKVVIADKECGITRTRRQRRAERQAVRDQGFLPRKAYMNINAEVCRFCLACTEITGCPGLRHVATDYGPKMDTDLTWCVADGACERLGACDAFETVIVTRKRPPKSRVPELGLDEIPEPRKRQPGDIWRACLTGVGGMGIGVATSILVRAGHKEGHHVLFLDRKGLAIRNGGVVSQVTFNLAGQATTSVIPFGKADLLLGVDILEAARCLDPAGRFRIADPNKTAAVINTDKIATISGLMGREDYDPEQLVQVIRSHTRQDDFLARNISRLCEKYLGSKIYANIMMLGYAFQQGLIPVSMHAMAWAIKDTIRVDFKKNLYAFNMGRKLVESPELFQGPPQKLTWQQTLEEKCRYLLRRYGKNSPLGEQYRQLTAGAVRQMSALEEKLLRDLVVRAYDCLRWGGIDYATRYVNHVLGVYKKDHREYEFAATRAVIHNLASAMLIKDAVYKAELATSKEKYRRDHEKYNVNLHNGDRIRYRHLWNPRVRLFGREWRFNLTLRDWQLKTLKRMRWLRPVLAPLTKFARDHRDRYEAKVAAFDYTSADDYRRQLTGLASPACMTCQSPACSQLGCPLAGDIPEWMRLANDGQWKPAAERLLESNNFPEFTAEICPAFCETACKRTLNDYPVQVRDMERQIIERAWQEGWITPRRPEQTTGKAVAVVGSGPAGLAAAQQLRRAGHDVTVFEADDQPGGLLRYGIPDFRLGKDLLDRRLDQLRDEGVNFECNNAVGRDLSAADLRDRFDAVCLTVGARQPRDLDIPGRDKKGIVHALDFLCESNGHALADVRDKVVAVIGAGLTGEDCVEAALRAGAKEVHQLDILPKAQAASTMLADIPEAVQQHWNVSTREFLGSNGRLEGLRVGRVTYTPSAHGRRREEIPGSEHDLPADVVILAMGFQPVMEPTVVEQLGLTTDEAGKVMVNDYYTTNVRNIFAAGDAVTGAGYVATAIDSARNAARHINSFLRS